MSMRLSKTVEQACCVLSILAEHHGRPVTNTEFNQRMGVSPSYLTKITRKLVLAGLISSTQGVNGGFILAKPMALITVAALVIAIEGREHFFRPDGVIERAFPAHGYFVRNGVKLLNESFVKAEQKWFNELNQVTMEQLVSNAKSEAL